jgi:hypothetical protein
MTLLVQIETIIAYEKGLIGERKHRSWTFESMSKCELVGV